MRYDPRDMTHGNLWKQILIFSLPLMVSNLLQVLFNMSDVAVVGRFAGSTALGAVGSTSILVSLFTGFLIGLSGGINVLVARFYGARHEHDVEKTVHSAAIVSLIAGVVLLFVGLLGSPFMLRLLNTKDDLLPGAILYLRVYFLGMPALALYNFGNAVFSAIGDTKKPLMYLSIAGALNIALNLFFVIVCQLSVMGVALASAISQCVSAGLILHALTKVQDCYVLDTKKLHLDPATTKSILGLGLPAGFQNAIFAIANLFIQAGVLGASTAAQRGKPDDTKTKRFRVRQKPDTEPFRFERIKREYGPKGGETVSAERAAHAEIRQPPRTPFYSLMPRTASSVLAKSSSVWAKETIATSKADGATKMFRSRMARKKREYISVSEFFTSSKLRSGPSEKNIGPPT